MNSTNCPALAWIDSDAQLTCQPSELLGLMRSPSVTGEEHLDSRYVWPSGTPKLPPTHEATDDYSMAITGENDQFRFNLTPFNAGVWVIANNPAGRAIMDHWTRVYVDSASAFWKPPKNASGTLTESRWTCVHPALPGKAAVQCNFAGEDYEQGAFVRFVLSMPELRYHIRTVPWEILQSSHPHPLVHHFLGPDDTYKKPGIHKFAKYLSPRYGGYAAFGDDLLAVSDAESDPRIREEARLKKLNAIVWGGIRVINASTGCIPLDPETRSNFLKPSIGARLGSPGQRKLGYFGCEGNRTAGLSDLRIFVTGACSVELKCSEFTPPVWCSTDTSSAQTDLNSSILARQRRHYCRCPEQPSVFRTPPFIISSSRGRFERANSMAQRLGFRNAVLVNSSSFNPQERPNCTVSNATLAVSAAHSYAWEVVARMESRRVAIFDDEIIVPTREAAVMRQDLLRATNGTAASIIILGRLRTRKLSPYAYIVSPGAARILRSLFLQLHACEDSSGPIRRFCKAQAAGCVYAESSVKELSLRNGLGVVRRALHLGGVR
uniref:Uncharacterized protein n=2 Tax=Chrysotila carterae TaxID=13221 RepID=A0A7S4BP46_CHRCT